MVGGCCCVLIVWLTVRWISAKRQEAGKLERRKKRANPIRGDDEPVGNEPIVIHPNGEISIDPIVYGTGPNEDINTSHAL